MECFDLPIWQKPANILSRVITISNFAIGMGHSVRQRPIRLNDDRSCQITPVNIDRVRIIPERAIAGVAVRHWQARVSL